MKTPEIDSRDYILAFELHSMEDCPPDFQLGSTLRGFDAGLFLPGDDPDWLGRSTYPPRVLVLRGGQLIIVPHPSAHEPTWECPLRELLCLESGQMLLKGWFRFAGSAFDKTIPYNTRGYRAVTRFMYRLRQQWLGVSGGPAGAGRRMLEPQGLDLKFGHALAYEVDPDETITATVFQPPRALLYRRWPLPRRRWIPGDLLALTGRRLLWITDRDRGSYSRYGTIARFARLEAVVGANLEGAVDGYLLTVCLTHGSPWLVSVGAESRQVAEKLIAALQARKDHHALGSAPRG